MSDPCIVVRNVLVMLMMCSASLDLIKLQLENFVEENEETSADGLDLVELSSAVANSLNSVKRCLLQEEVLEPRKRAYTKWDFERAKQAIDVDY